MVAVVDGRLGSSSVVVVVPFLVLSVPPIRDSNFDRLSGYPSIGLRITSFGLGLVPVVCPGTRVCD